MTMVGITEKPPSFLVLFQTRKRRSLRHSIYRKPKKLTLTYIETPTIIVARNVG